MTTTTEQTTSSTQQTAKDQEFPKKPVIGDFVRDLANKMIDAIQTRQAPWQKLNVSPDKIPPLPHNGSKKNHKYIGASAVKLMLKGSDGNDFRTFKQISGRGYSVKGQKSEKVLNWQKNENNENVAQSVPVFDFNSTTGVRGDVPVPNPRTDVTNRHERAEAILSNCTAKFEQGPEGKFEYNPKTDTITLPERPPENSSEKDKDRYYDQAITQVVKSMGHESRLDRPGVGAPPGSTAEAMEALHTELAMAFISQDLGLPHHGHTTMSHARTWCSQADNHPMDIAEISGSASKCHSQIMQHERQREQTNEQQEEQTETKERTGTDQEHIGNQGRGGTSENERNTQQVGDTQEAPPQEYKRITENERQTLENKAAEKLDIRKERTQEDIEQATKALQEKSAKWKPLNKDNSFLSDKGIENHSGMFQAGKAVAIPAINMQGETRSAVYIREGKADEQGKPQFQESFAKGAKFSGCFAAIDGIESVKTADAVIVATKVECAATISEAMKDSGMKVATVAALSTNNMSNVVKNIQAKRPGIPVIPVGQVVEKEAVEKVAKLTNTKAVTPKLGAGDKEINSFNDLAKMNGKAAVTEQLGPVVELRIERSKDATQEKSQDKKRENKKEGKER